MLDFRRIFILLALLVCSIKTVFGVEPKVGILFDKALVGEAAFGYRINFACKNLGWQSEIINQDRFDNFTGEGFDFVICITPADYSKVKCTKYLLIFLPNNLQNIVFDRNKGIVSQYADFDAYLTSFNPLDFPDSRKAFENFSHKFLIWYPTVHNIKKQATQRKSLFMINNLWGDRAKSEKYLKLFHILSKQNDVSIYGRNNSRIKTKGVIPFNDESLYDISSNCGISLVIHSSVHRDLGIPTGRIFESAAVGNVIICDKNLFVEKFFGDNVLYIDVDVNYSELFCQIRSHIDWIKQHPLEAEQMAKNAHQIFQRNFLLENQLLDLKYFYEKNKFNQSLKF